MKLSELKNLLPDLNNVAFQLEEGSVVPAHFHVTEIGMVARHFIDCGGTIRKESAISFQLWNAGDLLHRLRPQKLLSIIRIAEEGLGMQDQEIEVEYQGDTIGRYGLEFNGQHFVMTAKATTCRAQDACRVPPQQSKTRLSELPVAGSCTPGSGCC